MSDIVEEYIELENRTVELFEKAGWDCKKGAPTDYFDIVLSKGDRVYGYVETYICKSPNALRQKMRRILAYMNEKKPDIFILTDGKSFETYFKGEYFSTTTIPIEYNEYSSLDRIKIYAQKIMEMQNEKKRN